MLRLCSNLILIALLSAALVHLRDAKSEPQLVSTSELRWVRTVDGWEPSRVLRIQPPPTGPPTLHPAVVAGLQLGVSLFALLALPTANLAVRKS